MPRLLTATALTVLAALAALAMTVLDRLVGPAPAWLAIAGHGGRLAVRYCVIRRFPSFATVFSGWGIRREPSVEYAGWDSELD